MVMDLWQALQFDKTAGKFHIVSTQIEEALSQIHYDRFDLSEEVHEQIKRAKGRVDSPDLQLQRDLAMVSKGNDPDPETVKRLSEKLHLTMFTDLKRESLAIHDLAILSGGDPEERFEMMSFHLKKIKDLVMLGNPEVDTSDGEKSTIRHNLVLFQMIFGARYLLN